MPDLIELTILEAVAALRRGQVSAREYAEALIGRCEAQAGLNALVSHDWDALMAAAGKAEPGRPLGGIPLVLKDNINTAALPTGAATGALKDFVASGNAPVAAALFNAGALLGGKGNMHELAFGVTNNNAVTGAARNPYDPSMIPGGSSGGVAVAVAARMMPGGVGTDTGASVRLPAALCGIAGFRPTVGRYSGAGIVPISHTRDTAGPMARSVADVRLLDSVMAARPAAPDLRAPERIRLGVSRTQFYGNLEPAVSAEAERVLDLLANAGIELVEMDIPDLAELNAEVGFPVALFEFTRDLPRYLAENGIALSMRDVLDGIGSPDVRAIFGSQIGEGGVPEEAYLHARNVARPKLQLAYAACFAEVEALIFPTSPISARPIGDDETVELNGERAPTFATFIRNTDPGSNAGIPGISLPVGLTPSRLPVGMELDGPAGADEKLLAIAEKVERIIGFASRPAV